MRYPKPKESGGNLIRSVIKSFRENRVSLPLHSHILIAVSGGSDSVALAVLLAKYGRRVGGPQDMTLIHVNHGWRGQASNEDQKFVGRLAKRLGTGFIAHRSHDKPKSGESWEAHARDVRKKIFREEAKRLGAVVLTAHTQDDLFETLLWRFFDGKMDTHGAGILFRHEAEVRPFLGISKIALRVFLKEERQKWREDSTNHEGRFLRSKMRRLLIPEIRALFPQAERKILAWSRQFASTSRNHLLK